MLPEIEALTRRKRELMLAYVQHRGNVELAAKASGYAVAAAYSCLRDPDMYAALRTLQNQTHKLMIASREHIAAELSLIATSDIREAFNSYGRLLDVEEWPDSLAAAVSSVELGPEGQVLKLKFWSKIDAARLLSQIEGHMQPEQHDVTHRHRLELSDEGRELLNDALEGLAEPIDITPAASAQGGD